MKKIEINTVNVIRTDRRDSHTGMKLQIWIKQEMHLTAEVSNEEMWRDNNEEKIRAIGMDRMPLEREMKRLMGLIK